MAYSLIMEVALAGILIALTDDPAYFSYLGFGLMIGLILGYYLESKKAPQGRDRPMDAPASLRGTSCWERDRA